MMFTPAEKITRAVEATRRAVEEARPGLPLLAHAAHILTNRSGVAVTVGTARKWLRAAVAAGQLHEIDVDYHWNVTLPGAAEAGVRGTSVKHAPSAQDPHQWVWAITTETHPTRPSAYGPGKHTLISTPERTAEIVKAIADDKKAKEEAERAQWKAKKEAERAEIDRRHPGLRDLTRRVQWMTTTGGSFGVRVSVLINDLGRAKDQPIEEREMSLVLNTGDEQGLIAVRAILEAGVEAMLEKQPVIHCRHCGARILAYNDPRPARDLAEVWWHVGTARTECADPDTKAEPEEPEYRHCGASLGRDEPPFTCNRRVAHKGPCGPDFDQEN